MIKKKITNLIIIRLNNAILATEMLYLCSFVVSIIKNNLDLIKYNEIPTVCVDS